MRRANSARLYHACAGCTFIESCCTATTSSWTRRANSATSGSWISCFMAAPAYLAFENSMPRSTSTSNSLARVRLFFSACFLIRSFRSSGSRMFMNSVFPIRSLYDTIGHTVKRNICNLCNIVLCFIR